MSVKISTKERLNSNVFNTMIIRETDGNFFVNVSNEKSDGESGTLSYKISDNLKKLDDNNKIICILESFLRNMLISSITFGVRHHGCSEDFVKVSGTRTLYLHISNPELLRIAVNMIKDKYGMDRYQYCDINETDTLYDITLSSKGSFYAKACVSCDGCSYVSGEDCYGCVSGKDCSLYTEFKLMYINGNIAVFDKRFIERFIYDKLWEYGEEVSVFEKRRDIGVGDTKIRDVIECYNIICGNTTIRFNCTEFSKSYVFRLCNNIVSIYNHQLLQNKRVMKRQLKMEGF